MSLLAAGVLALGSGVLALAGVWAPAGCWGLGPGVWGGALVAEGFTRACDGMIPALGWLACHFPSGPAMTIGRLMTCCWVRSNGPGRRRPRDLEALAIGRAGCTFLSRISHS